MRTVGERWEIVREIAAGGMGSVHEARHVITEQRAAVKLLHGHLARDPAHRERFLREVSAPARIGMPTGICPIYDAGFDDDGTPYIAMELLEGHTLRDLLSRGVPIARGLEIVDRLLAPLSAAHAAGIVHRDLKPENVFVTHDDRVLLLDFGIARDASSTSVTMTGTAMGTPQYMSPEQSMDVKRVGPATDVWAVGVMLYEILSGDWPFSGETPNAIVVAVCTSPPRALDPTRPGVTPALKALVERCLSKDPEARPRDASELRRELSRAARSRVAPTLRMSSPPPMPGSVETPQLRRVPERGPFGTTAPYLVVGAAVIGALVGGTWLLSARYTPQTTDSAPARSIEGMTRIVEAGRAELASRCAGEEVPSDTTTRVEVVAVVGPDGRASHVVAEGADAAPLTLRCIESTVATWSFPPSDRSTRTHFAVLVPFTPAPDFDVDERRVDEALAAFEAAPEVDSPPQRGELTAEQISAVVTRERRGLQRCWEGSIRGLPDTPAMRLDVSLTIGMSGAVTRVRLLGPMTRSRSDVPPATFGDALRGCVEARVRGWHFPPSSAETETNFPIVFTAT